MRFTKFFPAALALGASLVHAQRDDDDECSDDITITSNNPVINCEVVEGDIIVDDGVAGDLVINGPEQITGNLIVTNATQLLSLTSSSINAIGGRFELSNLELFSNLQMSSLRTVNEIRLIRLRLLESLTFGSTSGISSATNIVISDTRLSDLSGLRITEVDVLNINNNNDLISFNSGIVNITESLSITENGNSMNITMEDLEIAGEITLSNVRSFEVPSLRRVTSLRFDRCPELVSFEAQNLTTIESSLSFIDNRELTNISFPALTELVRGDMTIQNNTELIDLVGFPELERVYAGIILRGNFESVEMPSLRSVEGSVTVTSTTDIAEFCDFFNDLDVEGETSCTSNNASANEGGDDGEELGGGDSNDDDSDDEDEDAAGITSVNIAMLGVAVIAGIAQLL